MEQQTVTASEHGSHAAHGAHDDHGSAGQYVVVAAVVAVLTGAEILMFYSSATGMAKALPLLALLAVKFLLVLGVFMHLRLEGPLMRSLFFTGLGLALFVFLVALSTLDILVG